MVTRYNRITMNKEELVKELRYNANLLPKDILDEKKDVYVLAGSLQDIFKEYHDALEKEELFRNNFLYTISYTYTSEFNKIKHEKPPKKNTSKKLYTEQFINSVLTLPSLS